jgi:hypothetical protein
MKRHHAKPKGECKSLGCSQPASEGDTMCPEHAEKRRTYWVKYNAKRRGRPVKE